MTFLRFLTVLWVLCFVHAAFGSIIERAEQADEAVKWLVSIEKSNTKVCDGVQVSQESFLTLGDCLQTKNLNDYKIVMYDGEKRDIESAEKSTVKKMLVLLKTTAKSEADQDYPGIAGADTSKKYNKRLRVYIPHESGTLVATSVKLESDDECVKQGTAEKFNKDRHDCFTANPDPSTGCSIEAGQPILGVVKNIWLLFGFSTSAANICDESYKQATCIVPHKSWVEKMLEGCGDLPFIANGVYEQDMASSSIGSTASVTCDVGYTPDKASIVCESDGNWQDASCSINDCGPPSVNKGSVSLDSGSTTYGSTATLTCDKGYGPKTEDMHTLTCDASGNWEKAKCVFRDCGPIPRVENGFANLTSLDTTVGSIATVSCNSEYSPVRPVLTCQTSGVWETTACVIDPCAEGWTFFDNSCYHFSGNKPPTTYTYYYTYSPYYFYYYGYESTEDWASASSWCLINGGNLVEITSTAENAFLIDLNDNEATWIGLNDQAKEGNFIWGYSENASYTNWADGQPKGVNEKDCVSMKPDGLWKVADCGEALHYFCERDVVDCGYPRPVINGNVSLDSSATTYRSTATVSCDPGYVPMKETITCQSFGYWSTALCIIDCGPVPSINDGSVSLDFSKTIFGSTATVSCNIGYEPSATTLYCQISGLWTTEECTPKSPCPEGWTFFGGSCYHFSDNTPSAMYWYSYYYNYWYESTTDWNSAWRECRDWGADLVEITSAEENAFLVDLNNNKEATWIGLNKPDTEDTFVWKLSGNKPNYINWANSQPNDDNGTNCVFMKPNGLWKNTECGKDLHFFCKRSVVDCGSPPPVVNGSVSLVSSTTVYRSIATVTCDPGLIPSAETILCQASGVWDTALCIIECGSIPKVNNGSVSLDTLATALVATATVSCNAGYVAKIPTISCQASGVWETASCVIDPCPEGWVFFERSCYSYSSTYSISESLLNWFSARDVCIRKGANLADVTSATENAFLDGLTGATFFWIGLNDVYNEDTFIWASSGNIAKYTNWADGEPNRGSEWEDCVVAKSNGVWYDVNCRKDRYYFVCERSIIAAD